MSNKETSNEIAIRVEHVGKTFEPQSSARTIKEGFVGLGRKLTGKKKLVHHKGEYTALKDISFEVKKGDFLGIVGRNGCGKSTLLKILAGVYTPSKGHVQVNGKLTPFIELGVGFNPELSGRDNVFLNGALLGFTHQQMEEMYNDIVDFAELHGFMDTKLKNYSSGMQVRLAFSVAIRAQSEILLLDEVLAVGDEAFQKKCFDYFETLKRDKRTVLIVTHDMSAVEKFCTKALFIQDGEIIKIGRPEEIAAEYTKANQSQIIQEFNNNEKDLDNDFRIEVLDIEGKRAKSFRVGDDVKFRIMWDLEGVKNVGIALYHQAGGRIFASNTLELSIQKEINKHKSCNYIIRLDVAPGNYFIRVRLLGESIHDNIALITNGPKLLVMSDKKIDGVVSLKHEWSIE